jgi:hypothetical protein
MQGSNVGVQLRKLYNGFQFPGAPVLEIFDRTFGSNRSAVCALGIEANPSHSPSLNVLNKYFKDEGYQAIVLTETAASIKSGKALFHQDPGDRSEMGASLSTGAWQKVQKTVDVTLIDFPAFMAQVVKPLLLEILWHTNKHVPVAMKQDVEGQEYALFPALLTNGGLCDLDVLFLEPHPEHFRTDDGLLVGLSLADMEKAFHELRKANPWCKVQVMYLDDETYPYANVEISLPA